MNNLVIGITGGIGSGKSTFTQMLSEHGFSALIADDIAREIMITDLAVMKSIIAEFGENCYTDTDRELNAKVLADKVFNHPDQIKKLNAIVHPPTISKIENEINVLSEKNQLVFVESALIFEAKMEDLFDYILLITADENTRIKRVLERGVETASEIRSRMLNQIEEEKKKGRSDFIIENNSTFDKLEEKALFFLNLFKSLTKQN